MTKQMIWYQVYEERTPKNANKNKTRYRGIVQENAASRGQPNITAPIQQTKNNC
jgi:hypothetical protein